jgi:2-polyprenyl-3-methyl-5-hydroxy-6-metoxy-1,4-benzoquinol methylase
VLKESKKIGYLSDPMSVDMADSWYEHATLDHFWLRRRFSVIRKLLTNVNVATLKIGEIGCGHGVLMEQFFRQWNVRVDGFDLNPGALRSSIADAGRLFCYDVYQRESNLEGKYDLILLCDVLEHIEDELEFLRAVTFHLAPRGSLLINVPAIQSLYSKYDKVAGHKRRYSIAQLGEVTSRAQLRLVRISYWGLSLVPFVVLRQLMSRFETSEAEIIKKGFNPPSRLVNEALYAISAVDWFPQRFLGSSVIALARLS